MHRSSSNDRTMVAGGKARECRITEARHDSEHRDSASACPHLARALELKGHAAGTRCLFSFTLEPDGNPQEAGRYFHQTLRLEAERSLASVQRGLLPEATLPPSTKRVRCAARKSCQTEILA